MDGKVMGVMDGKVILGIDICVMEIGVNVTDGMDIGVMEIGRIVLDGSVGPVSNSLQLKSLQQPWTPLRMTQWRPATQYLPLLQHSAPTGAQFEAPQHL